MAVNSNSFLELFMSDLRTVMSFCHIFFSDSFTLEDIKKGAELFQNLREAAMLIQLASVSKLCAHLSQYLTAFSETPKAFSEEAKEALLFLNQLTQVKEEKLILSFISEHENVFNSLLRDDASDYTKAFLKSSLPKDEINKASIYELFCTELETQTHFLNVVLLELEKHPHQKSKIEELMRSAHSIKGAAASLKLSSLVQLAHALEECLTHLKLEGQNVTGRNLSFLFEILDFFSELSRVSPLEVKDWVDRKETEIESYIKKAPLWIQRKESLVNQEQKLRTPLFSLHRNFVRMGMSQFNHLMELSTLLHFNIKRILKVLHSLKKLKELHFQILRQVEKFRLNKGRVAVSENILLEAPLNYLRDTLKNEKKELNKGMQGLEEFIDNTTYLSEALQEEMFRGGMRPLQDLVDVLKRVVRDTSIQLGKKVRFKVGHGETLVDKELLEKLEVPLIHLIRNAILHGIELPEERKAKKKGEEGLVELDINEKNGILDVQLRDDGRGFNTIKIQEELVSKQLLSNEAAKHLSDKELFEYLLRPGISTAPISEIAGRGYGLNIVDQFVKEVRGILTFSSQEGQGVFFQLKLPLNISLLSVILVEIAGELYGFALHQIEGIVVEKKQYLIFRDSKYFLYHEGNAIELSFGQEILDLGLVKDRDVFSIILLKNRLKTYGIIVDKILHQEELAIQQINKRLGKIPYIQSMALTQQGDPLLILDV